MQQDKKKYGWKTSNKTDEKRWIEADGRHDFDWFIINTHFNQGQKKKNCQPTNMGFIVVRSQFHDAYSVGAIPGIQSMALASRNKDTGTRHKYKV